MNNIRQLTKDEYPKAIELSWQVFTITGKEDFNNEGLEFFKSFIYNKKCINEIIFYGSFDNEALTGIFSYDSKSQTLVERNSISRRINRCFNGRMEA